MKQLIIGFVFLFCLTAIFFLIDRLFQKHPPDDFSLQLRYWKEKLLTEDRSYVYEFFKNENNRLPPSSQHLSAHIFGDALFSVLGAPGMSTCDSAFGFGCFHGFFSRAVSTEGLSVVPALDQACVASYGPLGTGCQHGIGHGIMEYFGYSDINDALAVCSETTKAAPLLGCSSGVFMEYHNPLVISDSSAKSEPRPFDTKNPYDPCERVPDTYRASCFFELGDWWGNVRRGEYEFFGALCRALPDEANRKNCFLGVGSYLVPDLAYRPNVVKTTCMSLGQGIEARWCLSGATWSFYANPEYRKDYRLLCAGYDAPELRTCLLDADLTGQLDL